MNSSEQNNDLQSNFKKHILNLFKSPFFIIGFVITIFLLLVSIFPNIITPYSLKETLSVYVGSWSPPNTDHPLGTGKFGRDVLALLIYGLQPTLIIGVFITLIAFFGGFIFWFLDTLKPMIRNVSVVVFLILFFIVYWVIQAFWGFNQVFTEIMIVGELSMFLVFYLLFNKNLDLKSILKEFLIYFPLMFIIAISIIDGYFEAFLGNSDGLMHLGSEIFDSHIYIELNPLAFITPTLSLIIIILGFLFLHLGLKKRIQIK